MPSLTLQEPGGDPAGDLGGDLGTTQPQPDRREIRKLRRELRRANRRQRREKKREAKREQARTTRLEREARRERIKRQSTATSDSSVTEDVSKVAERVRASGPTGSTPPEGRPSADLYPDLTLKTLAPRIDATHREVKPKTTDITHREPTRETSGRGTERADSRQLNPGEDPVRPADIDRMVEQLHREIERKMRIERERRGL